MATLYDTYFPHAEALRPGPISRCPDSDIICITWLLELIGKDSENAGYKLIKAELSDLFLNLPERSRFNRRRRNLWYASEKLKRILIKFLPYDGTFIVDSFPIPICDFKRAPASTSPLKCADATGTLATYGKCATKGLDTFFGFRGSVITTSYGLPVDFAIATADTDDREVLHLFVSMALILLSLETKGMLVKNLREIYLPRRMFTSAYLINAILSKVTESRVE